MSDIGLGGVLAACAFVFVLWLAYRLGVEVGRSRTVAQMTRRLKGIRDEYGRPILDGILDPPSTRWD